MIKIFDNKNEWLEARQQGITGSDVAAILGLDKNRSAFDVYWEKTHPVSAKKPTVSMRRGIMLEPLIIELFREANPQLTIDYKPGVYELAIDDEYPHRRGTRDASYVSELGNPGIIEAKSTSGSNQHIWFNGIPTKYKCQTTMYMNLYQVDEAYIAYMVDDVFLYTPLYASASYRKLINNAADNFWYEHIQKGVSPEATTLADIKRKYIDVVKDSAFDADETLIERLSMFATKKEIVSTLETELRNHRAELDELDKLIRDTFGNYEFALWQDEVVARLQSWGKGRRLSIKNYVPLEDIINDD